MKLRDIYRLAHREYAAYKTRSVATIITVGALFGLLLGILFVMQGLENVTLRYAGETTDGWIYLANFYEDRGVDDSFIRQRIERYGGTVVTLSAQQQEQLGGELPQNIIVARFQKLKSANDYVNHKDDVRELGYDAKKYIIEELFSNQLSVYSYFQDKNRALIRPVSIVLVIVSAFILAFTMAHLIASNTKTFVLYRSMGAAKKQLFSIYSMYLMEMCFWAMRFAIILGLLISGLATGLGWSYLTEQLAQHYPQTTGHPIILIGLNWRCAETILCMYLAAPISFLLCLDQFSNKKIAQKLKGD